MSARKILCIGVCFSGFMCLRALAMTPASDAELAGVAGAWSDTYCVEQGGEMCDYTLRDCPETVNPIVCLSSPCEIKMYGPYRHDICKDNPLVESDCVWYPPGSGYCVTYRDGVCILLGDLDPDCNCIAIPFGDEKYSGSTQKCVTLYPI